MTDLGAGGDATFTYMALAAVMYSRLMKIWVIVAIVLVVAGLFAFKILKVGDVKQVQCRSKQTEAKSMLKEARKRLIDNASKNNNRFVSSWGDLAWEPKTQRYAFNINLGFDGKFIVEARAQTDEMNGDVWHIDELGTLTNKVDGCASPR